jgi:hypothetical protein
MVNMIAAANVSMRYERENAGICYLPKVLPCYTESNYEEHDFLSLLTLGPQSRPIFVQMYFLKFVCLPRD